MDSIQDGGAPAFLALGEVGSKSGGKLGGPAHLLGQGVVKGVRSEESNHLCQQGGDLHQQEELRVRWRCRSSSSTI